jgi:uncharacterized protein YdeI (YjbR/CyaY-like superfamily)
MQITETFTPTCRADWRDWLSQNGASAAEIWLVYYKKATGKPSLTYQEALEEALCFGWIDGIRQRMDEERYAQRFTPRRPRSAWSETNKRLAARLFDEGRMTPAGLAGIDFPLEQGESKPPIKKDVPLPDWMETALKGHPSAWEYFNSLPPSHCKRYIGWITSAKREETRMARLEKAIALLEQGKRIGIGPGEVRV